MNLGAFHRHSSRTPSPGGWWSPTRRSTGPRRTAAQAPQAAPQAPGGAGRRHTGARPSPSKAHRGTTVVGEMGTGKTFIGAAAAHMAGFQSASSSSARPTWYPSGSGRWR